MYYIQIMSAVFIWLVFLRGLTYYVVHKNPHMMPREEPAC